MEWKNIKRAIVIGVLLIINVFLIYRYLHLDRQMNDIRHELRSRGIDESTSGQVYWALNDASDKSLRLEFWVLVFFFVLVVYSLYVLVKVKLSYNDKKRLKERIPFEQLSEKERDELLKNNYCSQCGAYKRFTFKAEKMLNGLYYVIATCEVCSKEIKIRRENNA